MTFVEMADVLAECRFPGYQFVLDDAYTGARWIQAWYDEADTVTGNVERQWTRKWLLPETATPSEIVSTAFKCALTSMEHKTREWFTYKHAAVYQPHYDVETLVSLCQPRWAGGELLDLTKIARRG